MHFFALPVRLLRKSFKKYSRPSCGTKENVMSPIKQQRGSTLLVALVMLVLLTLIAVSAINSTTSGIQIVGNTQFRDEARAVAQQAIEGVISSNFTVNPAASSVVADINKDGINDYTANVPAPTCTGSVPIANASLNMSDPNDIPCYSASTAGATGIMYVSGVPIAPNMSWCYSQQWNIQATVDDSTASGGKTGALVTINQGVGMRVAAGTICN